MKISAKFILKVIIFILILSFISPFFLNKKIINELVPCLLILTFFLSIFLMEKYRFESRKSLISAKESLKKDNRLPVLFLRAFQLDVIKAIRPLKLKSFLPWSKDNIKTVILFDETLTGGINKRIGPFITLGNPNDKLPEIGAYRDYVKDDWKEVIKSYCEESSLILILEGVGEGLTWELEYIRKNISHKKILFLSHPKPFVSNSDIFVAFTILLKKCAYIVPHISRHIGNIYYVDEMWRLQILGEDINRINEYVSVVEEYYKGIKNG